MTYYYEPACVLSMILAFSLGSHRRAQCLCKVDDYKVRGLGYYATEGTVLRIDSQRSEPSAVHVATMGSQRRRGGRAHTTHVLKRKPTEHAS